MQNTPSPQVSGKMNPEVKAQWVAALRSGKYKQGPRRVLNDGEGGWCCLGVLCDLYAQTHDDKWVIVDEAMALASMGGPHYPAPQVREWASFYEDDHFIEIDGVSASAAVHNDGFSLPRRTFAEIADAIEAQL